MTTVVPSAPSREPSVGRELTPVEQFRHQLDKAEPEFALALPPHIPLARFKRVVQTAVVNSPDLMAADRTTLFASAMKAAQDGLLPDGRDGALVVYNTRVKRDGRDVWIKAVQWMPMIGGILKKIRNSGELKSIRAHVAYENDEFTYVLGDGEKIEHKPALDDRGRPRLVYAIAETTDGGFYREIMTVADIERVRAVSRAANTGPWVQWWDEMAKKTVLRRLAKRLPTSSDLDDLIRRDDELYDFAKDGEPARAFRPVASPLLDIAPVEPAPIDEMPTDAVQGPVGQGADGSDSAQEIVETSAPALDGGIDLVEVARLRGGEAGHKGRRRQAPVDLDTEPERQAWLAGFDEARAAAKEPA